MKVLPFMADKSHNLKEVWWQPAIHLFAQVSAWIVLPIIAALFLGRWLDKRFEKEPMFLIGCVVVAFAVTCVGLMRETVRAARNMEEQVQREKLKSHKTTLSHPAPPRRGRDQ